MGQGFALFTQAISFALLEVTRHGRTYFLVAG